MLLIRAAVKVARALFLLGSTFGLVFTSVTTLKLGYLTLTFDLILKVLVSYLYTQGWIGVFSKPRVSNKFQSYLQDANVLEHMPSNSSIKATDVLEEKDELRIRGTVSELFSDEEISKSQTVGTVVGWREDEDLYRQCLRSFAIDPRCKTLIAGVDGNGEDDQRMVEVFSQVYPDGAVIALPEALHKTLERYASSEKLTDIEDENATSAAMDHVHAFVRIILREELLPQSIDGIRAICITQPHSSKKDILFTALTFATVLAEELEIECIFSTDSDSIIVPGALGRIIASLEADESIGGVSGHLRFFNPRPSYLSKIADSHYWFEQELAKVQGAIFGATECQPGPCSGFRPSVLKSVLVPWYYQKLFGHRAVTNEDRHLTTRILWAGHSVHYVHDAIVYTETPNSFDGWVKQQVRWSRGTMIETCWYPWMINTLTPWHAYNIIMARFVPIFFFISTVSYVLGLPIYSLAKPSVTVLIDIFCMIAIRVIYLVQCRPDAAVPSDVIWLLPATLWFFAMTPGIFVWAILTILDDSWGNRPRAMVRGEKSTGLKVRMNWTSGKFYQWLKIAGFQVVWLFIVALAIMRAAMECIGTMPPT
ncbi:nucleotide-diphospho-sugar transferase [Cadophora sp. MPI-SDFR-AT-0126]|nr:nucleotide-diphospho-sugar transferase [Leotiomycetes sp. MPI-SDFR-AT-0126]